MSTTGGNKRAAIVGLFIFLGLLAFAAAVLTVGNLRKTFTRAVVVRTVFEDVEGLKVGNNVWFSGVKIGTVRRMNFFGKSQVEVIMRIDEHALPYIRKDALAKISSEGFIGNKLIVLYGGTDGAPSVVDGDMLQSETTYSTEEMMNTLEETNKNLNEITADMRIVAKQLSSGEGTLGQLLVNDTLYRSIHAAVVSLQRASANAQQMTASLNTFSQNLNRPGTFASDLVRDTVIFAQVRLAVNELNQTAAAANRLTTSLDEASRNEAKPLGVLMHDEQMARDMKETIRNLESSTDKLDQTLDAARHSFLLRGAFRRMDRETKN